jgi:hypothetical protein
MLDYILVEVLNLHTQLSHYVPLVSTKSVPIATRASTMEPQILNQIEHIVCDHVHCHHLLDLY